MNKEFKEIMQDLLQEEYPQYLESLKNPPFKGLRVNTLKVTVERFKELFEHSLKPSLFASNGFYINPQLKLGKHPLHIAGLFYLQEPSASSAVTILKPKQDSIVVDLCSAPGGKSGQIAEYLAHTGWLISNEIDYKRCQVLVSNLERLGVSNAIVTNTTTSNLAKVLKGCADYILVDAPCSGEGMFKKEEEALKQWSYEYTLTCSKRQMDILEDAYTMLKKDGILVYSTCTYNLNENEKVIEAFLKQHPDMQLVDPKVDFGRKGYPIKGISANHTRRIFPMDEGEGHFICRLQKMKDTGYKALEYLKSESIDPCVKSFFKDNFIDFDLYIYQFKQFVYVSKEKLLDLKVPTLAKAVIAGEVKNHRFIPHHHLYTNALLKEKHKQYYELSFVEFQQYVQGLTIASDIKGYVAMRYLGHIVGYAKGDGIYLKNKFPKGLRI